MFSQSVIEKLGFYVYALQHPDTGETFYIGKGKDNRVFQHSKGEIQLDAENEKLNIIQAIKDKGMTPRHLIIRHGLSEEVAFEVEAALIDFVGRESLSNIQGGHYSGDFGIKTVQEVSAMYQADELSTDLPLLLININRRYRRDMSMSEIYDATRKYWVIGKRRIHAKYAVATYRGLTREVFRIDEWYDKSISGKVRWGFRGELATDEVREALSYKTVNSYISKGAANPIRYVNC